jgi:acyl carrier protein
MRVSVEQLKKLIVDICGIDPAIIQDHATFKEDMRMDSLNIADLIASLEEDHDIIVDQAEAMNIRTFGQLVEYIRALDD